MVKINQLFEADAVELHDLRGDPNMVIRVQNLIQELLKENDARRLGIQKEIHDLGLSALPGVISATYAFGEKLTNGKAKNLIIDLIIDLCKDNQAAQSLLLDAGLLNNPFETSRQIASKALAQLDAGDLLHREQPRIVKALEKAIKHEERDAAVSIFELLLRYNLEYDRALKTCQKWFDSSYKTKAPARLLNLLFQSFPEKIEDILSQTLKVLEAKDKEVGNNIRNEVNLPSTDAIFAVIRGCSQRLKTEWSGRMKAVERLFEGAIGRRIKTDPTCIQPVFEFIKSSNLSESISRYWWQALGVSVQSDCQEAYEAFEMHLNAGDTEACEQLFFMVKGNHNHAKAMSWAKQQLDDFKTKYPINYREAEANYKNKTTGGGTTTPDKKDDLPVVKPS